MAATNLFPYKGNDLRGAAMQLRSGFSENPGGALVSLASGGPVPRFSEVLRMETAQRVNSAKH